MSPQPNEQLLNERELRAWEALIDVANAIGQLPELHPAEKREAVVHIHALQVSLLARCAYDPALR